MKLTRRLFVMCVIQVVAFLLAVAWIQAKPYGEYRKAQCEWCKCGNSLLNQLNVHHFTPQHIAPELRDTPSNLVTLCRKCHFVIGHKRNWTNSVPEIRVLFKGDNNAR